MLPSALLFAQLIAWQWTTAQPPSGMYQAPRVIRAGAIECTFVYDDKAFKSRTSCSSSGRELWGRIEPNAFVADAALLIDGATLYEASYSNISSGCILHAFDLQSGRERWAVSLTALGPIAHSQYYALVQLRVIGGQPVVFGWEAGGKYIEARDAANGALISNRRP
jgi:hypothetical protein